MTLGQAFSDLLGSAASDILARLAVMLSTVFENIVLLLTRGFGWFWQVFAAWQGFLTRIVTKTFVFIAVTVLLPPLIDYLAQTCLGITLHWDWIAYPVGVVNVFVDIGAIYTTIVCCLNAVFAWWLIKMIWNLIP